MYSPILVFFLVSLSTAHPFDFGELFGLGLHQRLGNPLCQRFKREIIPAANLTVIHSDDEMCNSQQVKDIISENLGNDVTTTKEAIYRDLGLKMGGQWTVICRQVEPNQAIPIFSTRSPLFCTDGNREIICFAFEF